MSSIEARYLSTIRAHVDEAGEESLSRAYELGRRGLTDSLGLLDVLALYEEMIRAHVLGVPAEQQAHAVAVVGDYFREFLSPFEMSFRGYQESNRELQRVNEELADANLELKAQQAQLVQTAKMASLGELVAGVAHEINNPLAFVRSHVSTATSCLSKVTAEVQPQLSEAAAGSLARAQSLLNQAVMNLVANGIDAIDGNGQISVSTGADADGYAILVADTGRGIPPDLRDRVFEPFFTTKPVGQGTGLGLSITYSIIERHRGTLELLPRTGGGTLAVIRLPLTSGRT